MSATRSEWIIFLILLYQWDLCYLWLGLRAPQVPREQHQSSSQGSLALQKVDCLPHRSQGRSPMVFSPTSLSCCCYCSEHFLPCSSLSGKTKSSDICWPSTANASDFYHTLVLTADMIMKKKTRRRKCSIKTKRFSQALWVFSSKGQQYHQITGRVNLFSSPAGSSLACIRVPI